MFDFGALKDRLSDMFEPGGTATELFSNIDLNPALLDNLHLDQLGDTLAQSGIDLQSLSDIQVTEVVQQVTENGGFEGLDLSQIVGKGGPPGQ